MNHVNWWLFGLSFAMGLVLTLTLMLADVKSPLPVHKPTDAEPPTTKTPAGEQRTTKIPVTERRTTQIPVTQQRTTKIPVTKDWPTTRIPVPPQAPHGPGSAAATPDGRGPAGWLVKGRADTGLYYTPDDPTYDPTVADVWFKDEKSALQAGFTPWRTNS